MAIVIMLIAAAIYAYIINEVGSIIKRLNVQASAYKYGKLFNSLERK